jgi:hypothetical protein
LHWYTLVGSLATAIGVLFAGTITRVLEKTAMTPVGIYRVVVALYAVAGVLLAALFIRLSPAAEARSPEETSALPTLLSVARHFRRSHTDPAFRWSVIVSLRARGFLPFFTASELPSSPLLGAWQ